MRVIDEEPGGRGSWTSLVFPTYNPGPLLERTWKEVANFLKMPVSRNWEILYVCDGCTDGSAERLEMFARSDPARVRVLSYRPNRGKGYALRRGLEAARGQWRIFTDVDLAYGFDDVLRLAETLWSGADVAIATRTHPESRLRIHPQLLGYLYRRHLQSRAVSLLIRSILPVAQRDTQAGLKGMSAPAAARILPHMRSEGFAFDCELLTACARLGMTVTEVPVCVRHEDTVSSVSLSKLFCLFRELWRIRQNWRDVPAASSMQLDRSVAPEHRHAA